MLIGLGVLIRFIFIGLVNLLPEEAYYWNYARHLDIGYLDHPPMVAWLIYLSQWVLGKSELAVRLPAFLGWFVFAFFMYRYAERMAGRGTGTPTLLLLAVLPIYLSIGFLMTPDAPFYVFWAGALFFLERAIFERSVSAWYGAGLCLGLGLLSKFTMGLVVPAALIFMLVDRESRAWFRRPHPYLAMLLGLLLFMPVIYWNAEHQWMSFVFQGSDRWSGGASFHLHVLLGSVLVLLTPLGLYEVVKVLIDLRKNRASIRKTSPPRYRRYLFAVVFTLVPLAVFVVHSLQGETKLNWTGPVWLAILPLVAARISGLSVLDHPRPRSSLTKRWVLTASALLVLFSLGFGFLTAGIPRITQNSAMKLPVAWKAYGQRIEEIETSLERDTNSRPIVIGLDRYRLASEACFYDPDEPSAVPQFAGENLVGGDGLMWNSWVSPAEAAGRHGVLVSFTPDALGQHWVTRHFKRLSEIKEEVLNDQDGEIGRFHWRIGYDYRPDLPPANPNPTSSEQPDGTTAETPVK